MGMRILKFAQVITLFLFFFSFFPSSAQAAITILDISPSTINSADDIVTITATASALENKTQYLEVALRKTGESNYFGLTKNGGNEWYSYKAAPTQSDLTSYFYAFTPVNGAWSGQLQAKLDITESAFKGAGSYDVKLRKYISSSPTDSNIVTLTVNVTIPPTPIPTAEPTATPKPTRTPQPTNTPKPTAVSTPTQVVTKTPTITIKKKEILSAKTSVTPSVTKQKPTEGPSPTPEKSPTPSVMVKASTSSGNIVAPLFISIGTLLLLACGILGLQEYRKKHTV